MNKIQKWLSMKQKQMLEYGVIEKYNKRIHGPIKKTNTDKYFSHKYLSFESKQQNESCEMFCNEIDNLVTEKLTLKQVYHFGHYTFAIDREDLIKKIQKMWKQWIYKRFHIKNLRKREVFGRPCKT